MSLQGIWLRSTLFASQISAKQIRPRKMTSDFIGDNQFEPIYLYIVSIKATRSFNQYFKLRISAYLSVPARSNEALFSSYSRVCNGGYVWLV